MEGIQQMWINNFSAGDGRFIECQKILSLAFYADKKKTPKDFLLIT